jgi:Ser/Thr protein kinase RdoA (MazF antagonist)
MLPVSELVSVARTAAEDGSSPLAVRAAQDWGYHRVRFLRSSANHVFHCTAAGREPAVLRFRPDGAAAREQARRVAELATQLASAGAPVSPAIASVHGELTTLFASDGARYVASLYSAVSGHMVDAEETTLDAARSWGRGLALLHEMGTRSGLPNLPRWLETLNEAAELIREREVRVPASAIIDALAQLPTSADLFGVVHGDPELDNVIWVSDETPVFVDLDDAGWSWFAADVCFALRDFAAPAAAPDLDADPVATFLAGYREQRTLTEEELSLLPLFARAHALITFARLERPRAEPVDASWPEWAKRLRMKLDAVAATLRTALIPT